MFRSIKFNSKSDLSAGLTVAILGIPQGMAFASIAGLPAVTGLYTSIVPCIIAALAGSSRHLVTGPSNVTSMMIYSSTAALVVRYNLPPLEVALLLAFLSGLVQLLFGLFKLGSIVKYISNSVVMGFTTGAAILIIANQIRDFLGIRLVASGDAHFLVSLWETFSALPTVNPLSLLIAALCLFVIIFGKRRFPRLPAPLIALLLCSILVFVFRLNGDSLGHFRVAIAGDNRPIQGGLSIFHLPVLLLQPNWLLLRDIASGVFSIAILGLIQSATIARSIATQSGQRINFNREFVALGAANLIGSFFQCFPSAGSFNRSAACYQSGGRSRLAIILSAVISALFLLWLGPLANLIPKPAFAALLMITAWHMINHQRFMMIWRTSRHSRLVLGGTLAASLLLSLEYAVFIGMFLSIAGLLYVTGKPYLTELSQRPDGGFDETPFNRNSRNPVVVINLEGYFYFASVDDLDYELMQAVTDRTQVVVLRMKRLRAIGSSAMTMLGHLHDLLAARGIHLVVCGINNQLRQILTDSGIRAKLGEQNIFYADNRLFQSTELALAHARSIVAASLPSAVKKGRGARTAQQFSAEHLAMDRFLRFGKDHQLREALWLLSSLISSGRSGPRPFVFLQDENGRMAEGLSLTELLMETTANPGFHSHPTASYKELQSFFRENYTRPVSSMVQRSIRCVPATASLPAILAACVRNNCDAVPVLDEEGRMSGVIEHQQLIRAILRIEKKKTRPAKGGDA